MHRLLCCAIFVVPHVCTRSLSRWLGLHRQLGARPDVRGASCLDGHSWASALAQLAAFRLDASAFGQLHFAQPCRQCRRLILTYFVYSNTCMLHWHLLPHHCAHCNHHRGLLCWSLRQAWMHGWAPLPRMSSIGNTGACLHPRHSNPDASFVLGSWLHQLSLDCVAIFSYVFDGPNCVNLGIAPMPPSMTIALMRIHHLHGASLCLWLLCGRLDIGYLDCYFDL